VGVHDASARDRRKKHPCFCHPLQPKAKEKKPKRGKRRIASLGKEAVDVPYGEGQKSCKEPLRIRRRESRQKAPSPKSTENQRNNPQKIPPTGGNQTLPDLKTKPRKKKIHPGGLTQGVATEKIASEREKKRPLRKSSQNDMPDVNRYRN